MKKIILLSFLIITLCSCGRTTKENIKEKFIDKVKLSDSYNIKGVMTIYGDEDTFTYDLETIYLKDNKYMVSMVNKTNNHEQIIIRNNEGVFVVTPSLNKSFKFQSEWPNNSSQSFVLESLAKDIENDKSTKVSKEDDKYILELKANYPNNPELIKQRIILDDFAKLKIVEVMDSKNNIKIKMKVNKIDMKYNAKEEDFELDRYINNDEETNNNEKECERENCERTSSLENAIYPLYIPSETKLTNSEKIETDNGNRVILTFSGSKNFVLVEETSQVFKEHEIIPVYGEPIILQDTIAVLSDNSINWTSNNVDYYLTSKDLDNNEILTIASSLGNTISVASSK